MRVAEGLQEEEEEVVEVVVVVVVEEKEARSDGCRLLAVGEEPSFGV